MKIYFARNKDNNVVKQSSSGGLFSLLAQYVIERHGVVFGAAFDENFNVEITYTEHDFSKFLGSKYVQSDVKKTYSECKEFLEQGRLVLYTGTPCQIIGLKAFLKKDYDKLITADIICHGSPIKEIWQHYLKSFCKEIDSVNFRDKNNGWSQYHLTIKFKDGTVFSENHNSNSYMKLFLENKILKESCYTCKCCKNSKADITLGDAWGIHSSISEFRNDTGVNCVIIRTTKGNIIFNDLPNKLTEQTNEEYLAKNSVGYVHNYEKPADVEHVKSGILNPKIAMVTIPGHNNVGNTLQAFALQQKVKELLPTADIEIINDFDLPKNKLEFYKTHVKSTSGLFNNTYDMLLVGSDQIWGSAITKDWKILFEDIFGIRNTKRIFYAPSFGFIETKYTDAQKQKIATTLKHDKFISNREMFGAYMTNKMFNVDCASVLDPAFLHDAQFYLNTIQETICDKCSGIFCYILDKSDKWTKYIEKVKTITNQNILPYDGSVEQFLHNMNTASIVLTDSYHGTVFSLIFNKSFMCLRNKARGNLRFSDLSLRFDIDNRFVDDLSTIDKTALMTKPNADIEQYKADSINFLNAGLHQL